LVLRRRCRTMLSAQENDQQYFKAIILHGWCLWLDVCCVCRYRLHLWALTLCSSWTTKRAPILLSRSASPALDLYCLHWLVHVRHDLSCSWSTFITGTVADPTKRPGLISWSWPNPALQLGAALNVAHPART
jgi:hypothetical protein